MARLAWFTPLPPASSGIAQYSAELLPQLMAVHQIDVFADGPPGTCRSVPGASIYRAHDFLWKHLRAPYDLVVYQLGNAPCHDYMWAYLVRYPGLVVLHDGQLHHARARCLLQQKREEDYRTEFRFNHPDANPDLAELGIVGLLGAATYLWPMLRVVVETARQVIVHNEWLGTELRERHRRARVRVVEMGVPAPTRRGEARERVLRRYAIPADALLFTAFGKVTPEKLISPAIQALAAVQATVPNIHLLLAGETVDHYNPRAEAEARGVGDRVTVAGFVSDEEMDDQLAAADVCLCLRWPTSRETSASWLRSLAAGRPSVVSDLVHTADIPALDPRSWTCLHAPPPPAHELADPATAEPVAVSVDILDLHHSLRLAMRRLGTDAGLRAMLGKAAERLWQSRFTLQRMASGYRQAIDAAIAAPREHPAVRGRLPAHFLTDGAEHAARLLREMRLPEAQLADRWESSPPKG